ncbi:glutathione S-transferase, partial [Salmonella enterica subsp. enterica serovar Typhimurium]|nr:glutathione S-transferase [Salmonella enterica subsp. enterica serovar Typhimurium]
MKLIGSYTSPFVRKISILLLEKGITFEFVNELPYNADSGVARYNPLGKVPALVTDAG